MVELRNHAASVDQLVVRYKQRTAFHRIVPSSTYSARRLVSHTQGALPYTSLPTTCTRRGALTVGTVLSLTLFVTLASRRSSVRASATERSETTETGTLKSRLASMFRAPTLSTLIEELKSDGRLRTRRIEEAMRAVDRKLFVPDGVPDAQAYTDSPVPIGYGETISAPHMHATALELLGPFLQPGSKVLDVGSGSGYLTAVMGLLVGGSGRVMGFEKHPELVEQSIQSINAAIPGLLENGAVSLSAGNVLAPETLEGEGPFDAIHVGAAADQLPKVLVDKLTCPGRMVIPVGPQNDYQVLEVVDKDAKGSVKMHHLMYVRYVPLTRPVQDRR